MSEFDGIIVNTEKVSARLDYVFHWLLSDITEWRYASNQEKLSEKQGVLNYSSEPITKALNIRPTEWIFEEHVRMPEYSWQERDFPELILDNNDHFDPIAAIFFLLSRVEEYSPAFTDLHGRYPSQAATNQKFLLLPLVDVWRQNILRLLGLRLEPKQLKTHFSFDIDSAFAYRYKGFTRTLGAMSRDLVSLRFKKFIERLFCVAGISKDPFDTYDFVIDNCQDHSVEVSWFFLLSDRTTENNNIHYKSPGLQKLISKLSRNHIVGIHPGYDTWKNSELMQIEIRRLNEILSVPVLHSRQHYLRFSLPETYRTLYDQGVRHEYSMGYADAPGFRAGTSLPFKWFDLQKNQATELFIHPFCAMDVTLSRYQKLSPTECIAMLNQLLDQIEDTGGMFHMLWHNETLSGRDNWRGWTSLWSEILHRAASKSIQ